MIINKKLFFVAESAGNVGVVGRVPATGCASGDIMWLLDEPNQPYEGNYYIYIYLLEIMQVLILNLSSQENLLLNTYYLVPVN